MRSVLIVFGIALGILVVAIIFTPSKGLVDNPAEEAYKRQQEFERKEAQEARRAKSVNTAPPVEPAPSGTAEVATVPAAATQGAILGTINVAGRGAIEIELYPKAAPKTVAHFTDLAKRKFYDGILFHRVIDGFVAQAGDPESKHYTAQDIVSKDDHQGGTEGLGAGGSGTNVPFESNPLKNEPGTLAMALSGPRSDTGDSQFFINFKHNDQLDGDYCVFGKVKSGMDVVNSLKRGDKISSIVIR